MKKSLLLATAIIFAAGTVFAAPAEPLPTRHVCHMIDGKEKCKDYKIHTKPAKKAPAKKADAKKKKTTTN
jgi:hypothetical protein